MGRLDAVEKGLTVLPFIGHGSNRWRRSWVASWRPRRLGAWASRPRGAGKVGGVVAVGGAGSCACGREGRGGWEDAVAELPYERQWRAVGGAWGRKREEEEVAAGPRAREEGEGDGWDRERERGGRLGLSGCAGQAGRRGGKKRSGPDGFRPKRVLRT